MDTTQLAGFADEMEKIGRSIFRDFMGGVDPTGGATFQYGMRDAEKGRGPSIRRAAGTVGGVVGGAAAVPAGISGLIGAVKGLGKGKGVGGRLLSAGRGFMSGAADPFKQVYHASKAKGALRTAASGGKLSDAEIQALHGFTKTLPGQKLLRTAEGAARKGIDKSVAAGKAGAQAAEGMVQQGRNVVQRGADAVQQGANAVQQRLQGAAQHLPGNYGQLAEQGAQAVQRGTQSVQRGAQNVSDTADIPGFLKAFTQDKPNIERLRAAASHLSPDVATKLQKQVGGRLNAGLATLGTSGAIGAGSAYLQYGKGQQAAQRYMGQGLRPQER